MWICQCSCSKIVERSTNVLNCGGLKSCGCLMKDHYVALSEITRQRNRKAPGFGALTELLNSYKFGAKTRNLDFNLTREEFKSLTDQCCYYCGSKPKPRIRKRRGKVIEHETFNCNGVDRKDSNLGYFLKNCLPCCTTCNIAKNDLTFEEFEAWLKQIGEYRASKVN